MAVLLKRVYDKPLRNDGTRILVDRLWPRGLNKQSAAVDQWLRDVAPSNELRKWFHSHLDAWMEFRKRYLKELCDPQASSALEQLYRSIDKNKKVTLLFASKNEDRNNATVLKELLEGARKPPTGTGPAAARSMRGRQAARAPRR